MAAEAEPMAVGVCKLTNRDGPSLFTNSVEEEFCEVRWCVGGLGPDHGHHVDAGTPLAVTARL
jgi:hypothetical protein